MGPHILDRLEQNDEALAVVPSNGFRRLSPCKYALAFGHRERVMEAWC